MNIFSHAAGVFSASLAALFSGCAAPTSDIPAVGNFDLGRYMGTWYEVARLPHRFERGLDFVRAEYAFTPDGSVRVVNSGLRDGKARSVVGRAVPKVPGKRVGELRVSFFRPFYGAYRVIELDREYRYAVVTGATRDYLWILSREPVMDGKLLGDILGRLAALGFATDKLEFPRQKGVPDGNSGAL